MGMASPEKQWIDTRPSLRQDKPMNQLHIFIAEPDDAAREIAEILSLVAERFSLRDNTSASRVPNTICSYCQATYSGVGIGARLADQMVIIDLNPRDSEEQFFNEVYFFASQELFRTFPGRVRVALPSQFVEIFHY